MSAHLSKLLDAALVAVEQQGGIDTSGLPTMTSRPLESLMGVAFRTGAVPCVESARTGCARQNLLRPPRRRAGVAAYKRCCIAKCCDI
jgi:hypothetical protein